MAIRAADGHVYRVMVAWPEGAPPPGGWPVLWILDGEDNFAIAAMTARRLERAGARSGVEPGVIVAVESGPLARRVLDYTPVASGYDIPAGAPASGLATGGAGAFLAFLDTGVRPRILARWTVNPGRQTLMGHSFGGLLALHALAKGSFWSRYVAISPSLWFGNGLIERELQAGPAMPGARLMIASGDGEGGPSAGGIRPEALAGAMAERGIQARAVTLAGQSHGSTMLAGMNGGILMAFAREAK